MLKKKTEKKTQFDFSFGAGGGTKKTADHQITVEILMC